MADVHGVPLTSAMRRVGSLRQLARVDSFVDADGPARGSRVIRVVNGGGLEFEIHPDRCLDIGAASFRGVPLAWISAVGDTSAAFSEPEGHGWLRTFGGGLLATCGLDSFGPPSQDEQGAAGMHGRIGAIPARVTRVESGEEKITVAGEIRQTVVFGENLVLRREISTSVGSTSLTIADTVTNAGSETSAHMILYHLNVGWPMLDAGATLSIAAESVAPRDPDAEAGFAQHLEFGEPEPGFREQVFVHSGVTGDAVLKNPRRGLGLTVRTSDSLPAMFEWKMTSTQHYVLGLEPANTAAAHGRRAARVAGTLPELEPGATVAYCVTVEVNEL